MADLSLLFSLKGQYEGKPAFQAAQADVAKLKQAFGTEFSQIQRVTNSALTSITSSLTGFSSRIPIVGNAINGLSNALSSVANEASGTSAGIAGVAGAAGLAVVAVGALTFGLIKAAEALFNATKAAAEFEGKFQDLSQQVGVSVETLSTLDVIASTTGGNIDTVAASLAIFQKNLESAHDPTSKEAKLLKDLGVTTLDTETSLRQAIKGLFALGETQKQTDSALQLFGRSGRFVNAILKESKGDLDAATQKFREMGLVVSTEAAVAADQFNDSIELLSRQVDALKRQLVGDVIPVITIALQDISVGLGKNKDDWESWRSFIEVQTAAVIASVQSLVQFISSHGAIDFGILFESNMTSLLARADQLKNKLRFEADAQRLIRFSQSLMAGKPGDTPKPSKDRADDNAAKEIQLQQQALEESTRVHRERLERERQLDLKSIDDWERASLESISAHLAGQQKIFDQERKNAQRFIKDREVQLLQLRAIDQKEEKAMDDFFLNGQKVQDDARKRRQQAELNLNRQLAAIRDAERDGELARIRDDLEQKRTVESVAIQREIALLTSAQSDRLILIDIELKHVTATAERKIQLDNEKIESERRFTDQIEQLTKRRIRALVEEGAQSIPRPGGRIPEDTSGIVFDDSSLGIPPDLERSVNSLAEAFNRLGESMEITFGLAKSSGQEFADLLGNALGETAFAVGDLAHQWALFGTTGPAAMRKITASVLAGLAAQAAVKAIFQLAEGFAMLFVNPAQAAAHFKSAALFGAVAAAAGIAGRSIAGDLFKPQDRSAAGNGTGATGQLNPLTLARNAGPGSARQNAPQITPSVNVTVAVVPDGSKFGNAITAHVVDNINNAGTIREILSGDGNLNRG